MTTSTSPAHQIQSHPQSNAQPNPLYPQLPSSSNYRRSNYPISLNSTTTHPSAIKFNNQNSTHPYPLPNTILTRSDLRESVETFANMLSTAKAYRSALMSLSSATSAFAKSLEDCARLKGAQSPPSLDHDRSNDSNSAANSSHSQLHDFFNNHSNLNTRNGTQDGNSSMGDEEKLSPGERLMAASGLHFMTANLEQVLSATFYKSFEIPLLDVYDHYRQQLAERQSTYEAEVSAKTKAIRETELRNMKQGLSSSSSTSGGKGNKQRFLGRDLNSFRKGLKELQDQVEAVEKVKQIYYLEVAGGEYEVWKSVADNISLIVKSEVEVYDRVASKATSDPTLEMMVTSIPDPFDTYNQELIPNATQAPEIYSILPPLSSILTPAQAIARKSLPDFGHPSSLPPPLTTTTSYESSAVENLIDPDPSYPSSPVGDLINPNLDSTTHWDNQSPTSNPELPPLPVVNYECDELEEDRTRYSSTSLFNSPPHSPSSEHPPPLKSPDPLPTIILAPQTFAPTPLRNMISMDSTSTEHTIQDPSSSDPMPNPDPEYSQETIRCPLSSTKRASVLSGISLGPNPGNNEESLMSQLPPVGIDSDSDVENSFASDDQNET